VDTVIYLWYGNGSITTSQENKPGVWDSSYQMVLHLAEASAPYQDSTVNAYSSAVGTDPAQAPGRIGHGQSFQKALQQYIPFLGTQSPNPAQDSTIETWIKTSDSATTLALGKWWSDGIGSSDMSYLLGYASGYPMAWSGSDAGVPGRREPLSR
jgi:hypothetical protein